MLTLSKAGRKYGALQSKPDHRDFGLSGMQLARVTQPVADLEQWAGPVKDQGDLGACTAFAGTGMRELLYRRLTRFETKQVENPVFSPMFLYYIERQLDGTLAEGDTGSTGRTCCRALNIGGVCLESEDSYAPKNFEVAPTAEQCSEALQFKSGAYHRLSTVPDMKSCLASGYAFIIGFAVFESFESLTTDNPTYSPDVTAEQELGGHEVLVIGYDDTKGAFKVRNSWGKDWADGGNFWLPYRLAADPKILMDAWMQHLGRAW